MRFDIFRFTLRQLLGFHRIGMFVLLLVIVGIPIVIASFAQAMGNELGTGFLADTFESIQLSILYPIVILFVSAMALREEIDNNTIVYLWTKPVSRTSIVLSKFLAGLVVAVVFCGISTAVTSLIAVPNDIGLALKFVLSVGVSLVAYGALYFTLSLVAGRTMSIILGLAYTIIWEGLLSQISTLTSNLSIRHYASNFSANVLSPDIHLSMSLSLTTSLIVLIVVAAVLLIVSILKFSQMEFSGES